MFQDEIKRYTKDPAILKMDNFKELADSCETLDDFREQYGERYDDAELAVYQTVFSAIRVAYWAQQYRGVHIDSTELAYLRELLNDLKADDKYETGNE